jgi:hypothetical protein
MEMGRQLAHGEFRPGETDSGDRIEVLEGWRGLILVLKWSRGMVL